MADITAAQIRKVREITGAGMTAVKKALVAADGDEQEAVDELRKAGASKAISRAGDRVASNGLIAAAEGVLLELACETDFVAKNEQLVTLASDIVARAVAAKAADKDALLAATLADGRTVEQSVIDASASLGEKIEVRRYARLEGTVATYLHKKATDLPPQIGVIVAFTGDEAAARGAAMQVSALSAQYLTREEVPADQVERERNVAEEITRSEGKPEAAIPKIVEGRVGGFFRQIVLLEQESVLESKKNVKQVLTEAGTEVTAFVRFEVGKA